MAKDEDWKIGCGCFIVFVLAMPFFMAGCFVLKDVQTSDGYRDGTIRKLSKSGIVWKTWEVEMLGDGFRMTSGGKGTPSVAAPETFNYTVRDPEIVKALQDVRAGCKVRLHYRKHLTRWLPQGETSFVVTSVEKGVE